MNNPLAEKKHILALDIGTSKIMAGIALLNTTGGQCLSIGRANSQGIKKGMVVDMQKTIQAIAKATEEAKQLCQEPVVIQDIYVGFSGQHVQSIATHGIMAIKGQEVAQSDVDGALVNAQAVRLNADQQLVHTFTQDFKVDNQETIQDPIGMNGVRLEIKAQLIATDLTATQNVLKCINRCNLEANQIIVNPFASSLAVLSNDEKEIGVVMVDIGAGTCDIAIYHKGMVKHIGVIPIAGDHISNDISIMMRMPWQDAEEVKIRYGVAKKELVNTTEQIQVNDVGGFQKKISRHMLSAVIETRLEELLLLIQQMVMYSGCEHLINAGYVFTGGTANSTGFLDLANTVLNKNCRIGLPLNQTYLKELLTHSSCASLVGILKYASMQRQETQEKQNPLMSMMKKTWHWLADTF